jgi:site-specific recombinase XerC
LKHIIRDLGSVPLADLDAPKCRSFIRQVEATGLSSSTTGLIMTVLRAMCETAVADRLMDRNPTSGIKIATRHAQEIRVLSPDEYRAVLAVTRAP